MVPRIVMPTSNRYVRGCHAVLELLEEFWPGHPPIDIVARNECLDTAGLENVRCFRAGLQKKVSWTTALLWYLECWSEDEICLLMLDDYGLCGPPDLAKLDRASETIAQDDQVASFHLTHMATQGETRPGCDDIISYPRWKYRINTQAAFWRKSHLISLLRSLGSTTIEAFELKGSQIANHYPEDQPLHLTYRSPKGTPLLLDADPNKMNWALPYHNLIHRGKWDNRHQDFLVARSLPKGNPL